MISSSKFIKLIEERPCLYNKTLEEYSRKDATEKVWAEVAKICKSTPHEVRERWKNYRNGYSRSLRLNASSTKQNKKPYYLSNVMQFLLPFIKQRNKSTTQEFEYSDSEENNEEKVSYVDVDYFENSEEDDKIDSIVQEHEPPQKRIKTDHRNTDNPELADDHRKMFLLSLLPDINSLTDSQMSTFRLKLLLLLEEVKNSNHDVFKFE